MMEPGSMGTGVQHTATVSERPPQQLDAQADDAQEFGDETFEATILRLDKLAAERLVRKAGL